MAGLILASASPRRRVFMELLGLEFTTEPAKLDEPNAGYVESPEALARALARAKASIIASRNPGSPVLAADTVVSLESEILGKPAGAQEAVAMLRALHGRAHDVTTGVAVVDNAGQLRVGATTTRVTMRPYSDDEIAASVQSGMPFDKAGGYAIQDESFLPVAHFDGCYCNVVGLPLGLTIDLLREAGVDPPVSEPYRLLPYCLSCPLFGRD